MTQGELATAAGISPGALSSLEAGRFWPKKETLARIDAALVAAVAGQLCSCHGYPMRSLIVHAEDCRRPARCRCSEVGYYCPTRLEEKSCEREQAVAS
jgi:transcriptional regulator with XRE-family HTH domain